MWSKRIRIRGLGLLMGSARSNSEEKTPGDFTSGPEGENPLPMQGTCV